MTERMRSQLQAATNKILWRVYGLTLRDGVGGFNMELGVELLLLDIKKSQLTWFGHLVKMPPGHLAHRGRPRTWWRDYIFLLALGNTFGSLRRTWRALWVSLPTTTWSQDKLRKLAGWMNGWIHNSLSYIKSWTWQVVSRKSYLRLSERALGYIRQKKVGNDSFRIFWYLYTVYELLLLARKLSFTYIFPPILWCDTI